MVLYLLFLGDMSSLFVLPESESEWELRSEFEWKPELEFE